MKIRRIIVGLQHAPRDRTVLEAAARLAGRMEVELVGLFIENVNLLHFAGLPFAREVGFASATTRDLDIEAMERSLRALANEARRVLESVAGQSSVRWSFRVTRGSAAIELLAAASEADLVVADIEPPAEPDWPVPVRYVRAGDRDALRVALEAGDGILVLAGSDVAAVGETLRELLGREWM